VNRVVITGMGAITPVGNDIRTFWESLCQGKNGVGPITHFDASDFKSKVAAEVKDFAPEAFGIEKGDARRMDLFTQYAVAAAGQAVSESGILSAVAPERLGVYVGSGIGGMHTFVAETEKLLNRGPSRVSPLYIPMMIANIAAGQHRDQVQRAGAFAPGGHRLRHLHQRHRRGLPGDQARLRGRDHCRRRGGHR
jgi:3-oxoacyl-[acyl-carrier-protein] synthase II